MSDFLSSHADRATAGEQDAVAREQHLVLILKAARQKLEQTSRRQDLRDPVPDAIRRQAEQPSALLIGKGDGSVAVGRDRALMDALNTCLSFF